jgi:DNA-binding CsgD family transcriptional regulator
MNDEVVGHEMVAPLGELLAAQAGFDATQAGHDHETALRQAHAAIREHDPKIARAARNNQTSWQTVDDLLTAMDRGDGSSKPSMVHRTEVLANLTEVMKGLCRMAATGELSALLRQAPRDKRPGFQPQKRLSPDEIELLVQDYTNGECSIYDLADRFGIHRQTVAQHLKAHGLELGRTSLSSEEITRVHELAGLGWSPNRIGVQMQRDPKTIRALLATLRYLRGGSVGP